MIDDPNDLRRTLEQRTRELEASEERFRNIISRSADGVIIIDADEIVRFVNPAAEQLFDRPGAELVGQEFGFPVVAGGTTEIDVVRRGGTPAVAEMRIVQTEWDGSLAFLASLRDISQRKQAEEALRLSEARFRAIFDGAATGIALLDLNGRALAANPALQAMLGYSEREFADLVIADYTHADDVAADSQLYSELVSGGRDHYRLEKRFCRKDTSVAWGSTTFSAIRDEQGRTEFVAGMVENVTAIVEQRQRREAVLRVALRFAAECDSAQVLKNLLDEAVPVVGGDAGTVWRWDETRSGLVPVRTTLPASVTVPVLFPGQGVVGQAVERRAIIVQNDAEPSGEVAGESSRPVLAALAVPLLHEGRLFGALEVVSFSAGKRFSGDDAEVLELLGGITAAALLGFERARLQGVLLAARTAQHELNNKLALTCGYAQMLVLDSSLPPRLAKAANEALKGARMAVTMLQQLQRLSLIQEIDWGAYTGPTIDLRRSPMTASGPDAPQEIESTESQKGGC